MARVTVSDLAETLVALQAQIAEFSKRLDALENRAASKNGTSIVLGAPQPLAANSLPAEPEGITEEELLAISAAIGAFLGVRAHIRQIRLLSTTAWAQAGRVSIQASHSLQS